MDAQRALLDELMGSARNLTEEERKGHREIKWDDKEVCGCYMIRFCPHDLFVNTRSDLGVCPKIHDQKLKESFEKSPRHDSYIPKFEAELAHFCERLVSDLDRRVRRGRERLAQDVEVPPPPPISAEKAEQLSVLEEKIKNLLEQVESLGEEGKVDEAEALMRKVEMLNIEKTVLTQQQPQDKLLMVAQEKKMALCEICGSFLVANDAAERTQSHVTGKQHVGYGMVRDFLTEYKETKEKAREDERLAREREAEERKKLREKENESSRRRSGSSDRDRHRDRDNDRERDRYRERDLQVMEERAVEIDIENMTGADHVLLPDTVVGALLRLYHLLSPILLEEKNEAAGVFSPFFWFGFFRCSGSKLFPSLCEIRVYLNSGLGIKRILTLSADNSLWYEVCFEFLEAMFSTSGHQHRSMHA
ncbi:LUC7 N terminus domain-containing protein [Perilla frutescens var. hirtella]|uniref:LUC7 N terminus domain-containing protein n=1 Tax=Perilla frutescens var. hirtella TaxID=608512 RepID=A0AAD4IS18_PERFH|nr:LUC7 N terminus domain-containing protein [Perilla frutescens var. hirtella]